MTISCKNVVLDLLCFVDLPKYGYSLIFDSAMYQTIAIFQNSSGSLEWGPLSTNIEMYITYW